MFCNEANIFVIRFPLAIGGRKLQAMLQCLQQDSTNLQTEMGTLQFSECSRSIMYFLSWLVMDQNLQCSDPEGLTW
jgi:hypothetical protein